MIARNHWIDAVLGILTAAILLGTGFRTGWMEVRTDFPNYYTAAVSARQGLPLRDYYEWTWFQRQMNYTGTERQLGAYTPQTPLALAPFLPLTGFPPQRAKQIWLIVNAILLAATVVLLSTVARIPYRWLFVTLLAAFGSVYSNFVLGQYYLLLTFLLALSAWLLFRGRQAQAGVVLGIVFALKLYSGPFFLFFLAKRYGKAAAAMLATIAVLAAVSIAISGWADNVYYATSVLPSLMSGMTIDPYNPGQGSVVALLRRTFVFEPDLNPHPWISAPFLFSFSRSLFTLGVLAAVLLALQRSRDLTRREFAWLVVTLLFLAPVNATYVFALLIVPVALLLPESSTRVRILLLAAMALLGAPLPLLAQPWFPRVWILAAVFFCSGWPLLRTLPWKRVTIATAIVTCISIGAASRTPDAERAERIALPAHSIAAISPTVTSNGVIYQAFGQDRYVLRTRLAEYLFAGHAFHPAASPVGGPVAFELVAKGHSRILALHMDDHSTRQIAGDELDGREPCVSSDGKQIAFVAKGSLYINDGSRVTDLHVAGGQPSFTPDGRRLLFIRAGEILTVEIASGAVVPLEAGKRGRSRPAISPDGALLAYVEEREVFVQPFPAGSRAQLTHTSCNHDSPVWEADSRHLVFTSDCGRGLGLPALYRTRVR